MGYLDVEEEVPYTTTRPANAVDTTVDVEVSEWIKLDRSESSSGSKTRPVVTVAVKFDVAT